MKAMNELYRSFLARNLLWLADVSPLLAELVDDDLALCELKGRPVDADVDLFFHGQLVLEACQCSLTAAFDQQLKRTDGVAMTRAARPIDVKSSTPTSILMEMVDAHYAVFLNHLPSLPRVDSTSANSEKPPYRNLVVFGSLMIAPLIKFIQINDCSPWISITLVENDPMQLKAALSLFDLSEFVDLCRDKSISLKIHIDESKIALQDRLYTQVGKENPTLLYGWQALRSPVLSPELMELHSWLHAPEGAAQHVSGMLGFATDDINQTQQTLWNALSNKEMKVLAPNCLDPQTPIVLVASGPSLMDELPWLFQEAPNLNIVAAGSALGTLLRAGIRPSVVVNLERSAETYTDLCDLLADGFSLKDIALLVSSTIDPRLPMLFDQVAFFHRPASMSLGLFPDDKDAVLRISGPHVINAALEAVLALGSRQLLFIGADFSATSRTRPRADGALGVSPRHFNIPVQGSRGKTVFSEPGLLHTAYLLNRMIEITPDCDAKRLGQGVVLSEVQIVERTDDLTAQYVRAPGALKQAFMAFPKSSFNCSDCEQLFDLLKNDLTETMSQLRSAVDSSESWSKNLSEGLSPFLQRLHDGDSRQRRMLSQLLCQPLFYSAMSLYDAPSDSPEEFFASKANFLSSLDLLEAVVSQWLDVMRPWLRASQLPSWDPEWLRTRYRRMENQQA